MDELDPNGYSSVLHYFHRIIAAGGVVDAAIWNQAVWTVRQPGADSTNPDAAEWRPPDQTRWDQCVVCGSTHLRGDIFLLGDRPGWYHKACVPSGLTIDFSDQTRPARWLRT